MKVESFKCDVCGVMKGEANHWWSLYLSTSGSKELRLLPWTNADVSEAWVGFDICGEKHVQQKVAEFMAGGK